MSDSKCENCYQTFLLGINSYAFRNENNDHDDEDEFKMEEEGEKKENRKRLNQELETLLTQ